MRKPSFVSISLSLLGVAIITLQATAILAGPTLPYYPMAQVTEGPAKTAAVQTGLFQAGQRTALPVTPAASPSQPAYRPLPRVKLFNGDGPVHLPGTLSSINQASQARQLFDVVGYDLAAVREGASEVPRVYLAAMPEDLRKVRETEERKQLFLKTVLPLILRVNEEIAEDRRALLGIKAKREMGLSPRWGELTTLDRLATLYKVADKDIDALLLRVDEVPVALALAQAIEESGWGTSRLARKGNALFGQYAWNDAAGLVQSNRLPGETHVIRSFDKLIDAVAAYSLNLNTHGAYAGFRKSRAALRAESKSLDGHVLAGHLLRYSERGPDYIRTLRIIMRGNQLAELEQASLASSLTVASNAEPETRMEES
ncbi:MAG: glucosaminidase domain-containing protein [Alphaproteobacteria bacterium]|nr:glucosaminidase domain-containing protein [Alphaproteobacteria bacterium]